MSTYYVEVINLLKDELNDFETDPINREGVLEFQNITEQKMELVQVLYQRMMLGQCIGKLNEDAIELAKACIDLAVYSAYDGFDPDAFE